MELGGGVSGDEYLAGKQLAEDPAAGLKKTTMGSLFTGQVDPVQDAISKVRSDPLLAIKQQEQIHLKSVVSNPMKMRHIVMDATTELVDIILNYVSYC